MVVLIAFFALLLNYIIVSTISTKSKITFYTVLSLIALVYVLITYVL